MAVYISLLVAHLHKVAFHALSSLLGENLCDQKILVRFIMIVSLNIS